MSEKEKKVCCDGFNFEVSETDTGIRISITSKDPDKIESIKSFRQCCVRSEKECC